MMWTSAPDAIGGSPGRHGIQVNPQHTPIRAHNTKSLFSSFDHYSVRDADNWRKYENSCILPGLLKPRSRLFAVCYEGFFPHPPMMSTDLFLELFPDDLRSFFPVIVGLFPVSSLN